ncbi:alanyl-tRNA editing protein [Erwinia aphidicola]|uniref:alanyl-tRNA editing protein n=1 Tax=Erwinia aphidicola TaxID=68334 RepID=UPI001AA6C435|nr:alanyl-tRNA editing protein [Erwinia aphidicola]
MTERLYYHSDALECTSSVIGCSAQEDGRYRVILSSTLFHPKGGGQPSDRGTLGAVNMLHAVQEGDEVAHYTDGPVALGAVDLRVDAALRQLHTRYHSAGHLIAAVGEKFGWYGNKGDHRPGEGRVVFEPREPLSAVSAEDFTSGVAALVAQGLRRQLSEEAGRRKVTWGELPAYACGGTHVDSTAHVGEVRILKVKEKKGQLSVQYQLA